MIQRPSKYAWSRGTDAAWREADLMLDCAKDTDCAGDHAMAAGALMVAWAADRADAEAALCKLREAFDNKAHISQKNAEQASIILRSHEMLAEQAQQLEEARADYAKLDQTQDRVIQQLQAQLEEASENATKYHDRVGERDRRLAEIAELVRVAIQDGSAGTEIQQIAKVARGYDSES